MLTPDGKRADHIPKIILLTLWSKQLIEEDVKRANNIDKQVFISVERDRSAFPMSVDATKSMVKQWSQHWAKSQEARRLLRSPKINKVQELTILQAAVDYGNPQGDIESRDKMAKALTSWYNGKVDIKAKHLLFTVGGAGALRVIFDVLNQQNPHGKIVTPVPYYSLYGAMGRQARIHPIPVMHERGYRLTAKAFLASLEKLFSENKNPEISTFLFCDPNNPLGTFIEEGEWLKIAEILRQFPKIPIILDEAYAEMRMDGKKHVSLLQIAPDLKKRIILMRSATKALSAAGERMAVIVDFDEDRMPRLLETNINICGHAPRSLQLAFAEAMDKLDENELSQLTDFYRPKVEYISKRLELMGAAMPDADYKSNGAFYVLADLSDLRGLELHPDSKRALGKTEKFKRMKTSLIICCLQIRS